MQSSPCRCHPVIVALPFPLPVLRRPRSVAQPPVQCDLTMSFRLQHSAFPVLSFPLCDPRSWNHAMHAVFSALPWHWAEWCVISAHLPVRLHGTSAPAAISDRLFPHSITDGAPRRPALRGPPATPSSRRGCAGTATDWGGLLPPDGAESWRARKAWKRRWSPPAAPPVQGPT
eukprot:gene8744-biopygen5910